MTMPVQDDGVVRGGATESAPIAAATTRYRMLERIAFTFAFAALLAASPAYGECKSYVGDSGIQYVEYERNRYTICHGAGHVQDRNLVRKWVDNAFRLGREKYKVSSYQSYGHDLKLTIYLPPWRRRRRARGRCGSRAATTTGTARLARTG